MKRSATRRGVTLALALTAAVVLVTCTSDGPDGDGSRGSDSPSEGPIDGYVVYIAGMSFNLLSGDRIDACNRVAETFSEAMRGTFESSGEDHPLAAICYSYSADDHESYGVGDTNNDLDASAAVLARLVADLRERWREDGIAGEPDVVIAAHSLGGAVAALWANEADEEDVDVVSLVVTFVSPVAGLGDETARFWLSQVVQEGAVDDLRDGAIKTRMAAGSRRVRFAQIANTRDPLVPPANAFTEGAWRQKLTTCGSPIDRRVSLHHCTVRGDGELSFVEEALALRSVE